MIWNERKIINELKKLLPKGTTITGDNFDTEYETKKIVVEPDKSENALIFFGICDKAFEDKLISEVNIPWLMITDRETKDFKEFLPDTCDKHVKELFEIVSEYFSDKEIKRINSFEEIFNIN